MSAAAGGAGASAANAVRAAEPPPLELHRIPLTPFRENSAQYIALLKRALRSNSDADLEAMRPATEEEYYRFFVCAIARELKYLVNSEMFPQYMNEELDSVLAPSYSTRVMKAHYGVRQSEITRALTARLGRLRRELGGMLGALPSTANRYVGVLNSDFRKRRPWGAETPEEEPRYYESYLESSITVLQECIRVIKKGHPLRDMFMDVPTTLFLYCRRGAGGEPLYAGHIFAQIPTGVPPEFVEFLGASPSCPDPETLPYTFFVSIYKSLLDKGKALSARILADVEAYARENRCALMLTVPLPNMDRILVKYHFRKFEMPRERGRARRVDEEGRGGDPVFLRGLGSKGKIACGSGSTESTGSKGSTKSTSAGAGAGTRRSSSGHSSGGRRRTRRASR